MRRISSVKKVFSGTSNRLVGQEFIQRKHPISSRTTDTWHNSEVLPRDSPAAARGGTSTTATLFQQLSDTEDTAPPRGPGLLCHTGNNSVANRQEIGGQFLDNAQQTAVDHGLRNTKVDGYVIKGTRHSPVNWLDAPVDEYGESDLRRSWQRVDTAIADNTRAAGSTATASSVMTSRAAARSGVPAGDHTLNLNSTTFRHSQTSKVYETLPGFRHLRGTCRPISTVSLENQTNGARTATTIHNRLIRSQLRRG